LKLSGAEILEEDFKINPVSLSVIVHFVIVKPSNLSLIPILLLEIVQPSTTPLPPYSAICE
jgi:hypothetical protein